MSASHEQQLISVAVVAKLACGTGFDMNDAAWAKIHSPLDRIEAATAALIPGEEGLLRGRAKLQTMTTLDRRWEEIESFKVKCIPFDEVINQALARRHATT